jgi:hypothetical protein
MCSTSQASFRFQQKKNLGVATVSKSNYNSFRVLLDPVLPAILLVLLLSLLETEGIQSQ